MYDENEEYVEDFEDDEVQKSTTRFVIDIKNYSYLSNEDLMPRQKHHLGLITPENTLILASDSEENFKKYPSTKLIKNRNSQTKKYPQDFSKIETKNVKFPFKIRKEYEIYQEQTPDNLTNEIIYGSMKFGASPKLPNSFLSLKTRQSLQLPRHNENNNKRKQLAPLKIISPNLISPGNNTRISVTNNQLMGPSVSRVSDEHQPVINNCCEQAGNNNNNNGHYLVSMVKLPPIKSQNKIMEKNRSDSFKEKHREMVEMSNGISGEIDKILKHYPSISLRRNQNELLKNRESTNALETKLESIYSNSVDRRRIFQNLLVQGRRNIHLY